MNKTIGSYLRRMARQADKGYITAFAATALHKQGKHASIRTTWLAVNEETTTLAGLASALSSEAAWNTAKQYYSKKYPISRR